MKAKYIGSYRYRQYNNYIIELEYEYRGHRYTVMENRSKGNEPLSWQHRNEQARIDSIIEIKEREKQHGKTGGGSAEEAIDKFLEYCETGDESIWD